MTDGEMSAEPQVVEGFGCRLEVYEADPAGEPDPTKWVTEAAYRLAND